MRNLFLLGRILFGGFFILFGGRHFFRLAAMTPFVAAKGVPLPELAILGSGFVAVLAGLSILLGFRPQLGVALVPLFLIPVSATMHNFWADTNPSVRQTNEGHFGKNVAILAGALMLLAIPEPWPLSVGRGKKPTGSP
jgi:putative oxidoreductase